MYERHYGLRERPFEIVPNPRYLFLTPRQREAFSNLLYGLGTAKGLTLLLGEAGTGKTTLVQAALAELRKPGTQMALLSNPTLTRPEFYEFLAAAFHLSAGAAASKTSFLVELRRQLLERHQAGALTALIIDEAQSVPYDLLEEIRLLGNIETPTSKLLNIVLAGQPELALRLNEPSLRQLKQRIALRCELAAMDLRETAAYIAGRVRIAGGRPELIFTREAVEAVFAASGGVPRVVNVICDNSLLGGFAADVRPVTASLVHEVCRDFDLGGEPAPASADGHAGTPQAPPDPAAQAPAPRVPLPEPGASTAPPERAAPVSGVFGRRRRISLF